MKIRPVLSKDRPALVHILETTPEFAPAEVAVAEEVLDSHLRDPSGSGYLVVVAEANSSVLGYICYGPTPLTEGTWDIYWVAVALRERGQGIGRSLLAYAEARIREARGRMVLIETSSKPEYERTRRFHRSQGYELISRVPDFYMPGDDKLTFWKRLT